MFMDCTFVVNTDRCVALSTLFS